jgi:hypothetical protein
MCDDTKPEGKDPPNFYAFYLFEYINAEREDAIAGLYGQTSESDVADWLRFQNRETTQ